MTAPASEPLTDPELVSIVASPGTDAVKGGPPCKWMKCVLCFVAFGVVGIREQGRQKQKHWLNSNQLLCKIFCYGRCKGSSCKAVVALLLRLCWWGAGDIHNSDVLTAAAAASSATGAADVVPTPASMTAPVLMADSLVATPGADPDAAAAGDTTWCDSLPQIWNIRRLWRRADVRVGFG